MKASCRLRQPAFWWTETCLKITLLSYSTWVAIRIGALLLWIGITLHMLSVAFAQQNLQTVSIGEFGKSGASTGWFRIVDGALDYSHAETHVIDSDESTIWDPAPAVDYIPLI